MPSDELFSDQPGAPEASGVSERPRNRDKSRNKLSLRRYARVLLGPILLMGTLAGTAIEATIGASPAAAAQANACIDPATGGSSQTFVEGVPSSTYTVECEEETGISGTSAYPTITIATGSLPADGSPSLASGASCTTATRREVVPPRSTSRSASSLTRRLRPTVARPLTFTSTPGTFAGSTLSPATSGTLTVTISPPAVTCIDPASGGTAATWHEGVTSLHRRVRAAERRQWRDRLPEFHRGRHRHHSFGCQCDPGGLHHGHVGLGATEEVHQGVSLLGHAVRL